MSERLKDSIRRFRVEDKLLDIEEKENCEELVTSSIEDTAVSQSPGFGGPDAEFKAEVKLTAAEHRVMLDTQVRRSTCCSVAFHAVSLSCDLI